ncbi:hypothetical protein [Treponema sp. Marseille-Q4132]|uniref:hypothetical protein n=1 Tax=Treponema sp. Marseille-Q4132 TaxID=2766701 RepID=UPI001652EA68|nr:hypothetical protein [Treponema sp. Marseille-Q4132]QNL96740.1 hypothetical protein H9I35_09895 [Treponema sp. Marseille-Q4132]
MTGKDNEKEIRSFVDFNDFFIFRLFFDLSGAGKSETAYDRDRERKKAYRYLQIQM